ncbi:MAG: IS1634 family transposase [Rikenellaceae bacterium]
MKLFGGTLGALFYDVTTLYFETDKDDELRKAGFSKEGRHSNPQIILGLLVSVDGYPLAYTIHEGNKYEGHTMLPVINEFITKYQLQDFIVVADSGLLTSANIEQMEELGYKYIVGARIKSMNTSIKNWILSQPKVDKQMVEINYEGERRLLVGYTDQRARKDKYNRDKGIRRLEKSYRNGQFTKSNLNRKGYNKFLEMKDSVSVSIDYGRIAEEALWDGLKGYITNTKISASEVYCAYHNLWHVERSFRISKSKIEMRPMFHFTRRRIEAHICICFVALKVYKELDRVAKLQGIQLSVDKILDAAKTIITLKCTLPNSCVTEYRTLITTDRHKEIEPLLDREIWVSQTTTDNQCIR